MNRKIVFTILLSLLMPMIAMAQEYSIVGVGKTTDGKQIVDVVYTSKKKLEKTAQDDVLRSAVMGLILRGCISTDGSASVAPIVKNPSIETTKAEFFKAFEKEGAYKRYANIVPGTLSIIKNKSTKAYEASAQVIVDRATLSSYLEQADIISGFSDIW